LATPGGRGGSFAPNQGNGKWAETLLQHCKGSLRFINFGLSTPIAPTDPAYERVRRQHRYILLHEGKRPDLLLAPDAIIASQPSILTWDKHLLADADRTFLTSNCLAAVESKHSLWHWSIREQYRSRASSGSVKPLGIPLKEEEIPDLKTWQKKHGIPIVILITFVDSVHGCSLDFFLEEIAAGHADRQYDSKSVF
jgi:hypothetical protein